MQTRPVPDNRHGTQFSIAFEHVEDLVRRVAGLELLAADGGGPARLLQKLRCPPRPNEGAAQYDPCLWCKPQNPTGGAPEALFSLGCQRALRVVRPAVSVTLVCYRVPDDVEVHSPTTSSPSWLWRSPPSVAL